MRRVLLGVALGALLTILAAAPAGAVPPNEILIAKNLQRLGVVPSYATPGMARAAAQALAAKGTQHQAKPAAGTQTSGAALGKYLRARVVTGKAASTYATNALVLLVEFGTGAWPEGDSTDHYMDGPLHGSIRPPAPDDNATFWPGDFSPMHYQQMLFGNSYPIYGARYCTSTRATRWPTRPARTACRTSPGCAARATTPCATTTWSSRTAPTPCRATSRTG